MVAKLLKIAQKFRVKLAKKAYSDVLHIVNQAYGLSQNLKILLKGAIDDSDPYEPTDNRQKVRSLVGQLNRIARKFLNDSKSYGVSTKIASQYKSQLQNIIKQIDSLIVNKRYLPLVQPVRIAVSSFDPAPISRQKRKGHPSQPAWWDEKKYGKYIPIDPSEPEDPEPTPPLPPGLSFPGEAPCPPHLARFNDPYICETGIVPFGWSPDQAARNRAARRKQEG